MARNDEPKAEGEAPVVEAADGPLLDLSDAAVKRLIKTAKKRGWVTQDELNAVLPSDVNSSDQIEDINAMLNEMGISVVESEEAEQGEKEAEPADLPGHRHLARRTQRNQDPASRHHRSGGDLRRPGRQEDAEDRHDRAAERRGARRPHRRARRAFDRAAHAAGRLRRRGRAAR